MAMNLLERVLDRHLVMVTLVYPVLCRAPGSFAGWVVTWLHTADPRICMPLPEWCEGVVSMSLFWLRGLYRRAQVRRQRLGCV